MALTQALFEACPGALHENQRLLVLGLRLKAQSQIETAHEYIGMFRSQHLLAQRQHLAVPVHGPLRVAAAGELAGEFAVQGGGGEDAGAAAVDGGAGQRVTNILDKLGEIRGWSRAEAETRTERAFFSLFDRVQRS